MYANYFQAYEQHSIRSNVNGKENRIAVKQYRDPKIKKDAYYSYITTVICNSWINKYYTKLQIV